MYNWRLYTGKLIIHSTIDRHPYRHAHVSYMACHAGRESLQLGDHSHTHAIVIALLDGLEGRGHHVFTDNYYSGPVLFAELRDLGFGACGIVRINRRGLPAAMKETLAKGDVTSALVDKTMMALKWMDKRPVPMLTTIHDDSMTTKVRRTRRAEGGQEEVRKPVVVEEYNRFMGGGGPVRPAPLILRVLP